MEPAWAQSGVAPFNAAINKVCARQRVLFGGGTCYRQVGGALAGRRGTWADLWRAVLNLRAD